MNSRRMPQDEETRKRSAEQRVHDPLIAPGGSVLSTHLAEAIDQLEDILLQLLGAMPEFEEAGLYGTRLGNAMTDVRFAASLAGRRGMPPQPWIASTKRVGQP